MALTDARLMSLKAADRVFKVADCDGLCVVGSLKGTLTFRHHDRLGGQRETLTVG